MNLIKNTQTKMFTISAKVYHLRKVKIKNKTKQIFKEEFTSDFTASFPGSYLFTFSREEEKEPLGMKVQIVKSYDDVKGDTVDVIVHRYSQ